ncbi:MAG: DUF1365 domain-containing protein [Hyphomicrobiaceae bacterium]
MTSFTSGLYLGSVVHKRLRPVRHALSYRVFSLLLDCCQLDQTAKGLRLFSYNTFNLFSLYDRDHGDGRPLENYLSDVAKNSGHGEEIERFLMLCYPRILGYAFNPITVYFGLDQDDEIRLMIYEVNNTFGHRKSYVLPVVKRDNGLIMQSCRKSLYVSPFNSDSGSYRFAVTSPREDLTIGVALTTSLGATMKAHFHATRHELSDASLFKAIMKTGWMTLKVTAAIHYEALKLWLKGLKVRRRPAPPSESIDYPTLTKKSAS